MFEAARILIVDSGHDLRDSAAHGLSKSGYLVTTVQSSAAAIEQLDDLQPDVILTDLVLAGSTGIELIAEVRARTAQALVIVVSSRNDVESAVDAMTAGAADYLTKPVSEQALVAAVRGALERRSLESVRRHLALPLALRPGPGVLVGASIQSQEVLRAVSRVASSSATVLLVGESGTGKDLVATTLHARSRQARGPFVKVHCGALDDDLDREPLSEPNPTDPGGWLAERFEQAVGGTLYLDAVDDASRSVQARLAHALQAHEVQLEGDGRRIGTDVRIIASSRRELVELAERGELRADLFYRLEVVTIHLPPLRYRPADVPSLAMHFLARFARQNDKPVRRISSDALDVLTAHAWPGNVRELENVIERAVLLASSDTITLRDLPHDLCRAPLSGSAPSIPGASLAEIERYAILKTLEAQQGKIVHAARVLGISARTVHNKLRQYGIHGPGSGSGGSGP